MAMGSGQWGGEEKQEVRGGAEKRGEEGRRGEKSFKLEDREGLEVGKGPGKKGSMCRRPDCAKDGESGHPA